MPSALTSHKDLKVWREAVVLAADTYKLTARFPKEEQYGIAAQMRRASVSIGSNIAEGAARQGPREFIQFLYFASGSASELYTQLEIAKCLYPARELELLEVQGAVENVSRMLHGLIRGVRARSRAP